MTVSFTLDSESERRLEALAAQTGESPADLIRNAIANGINDLEDYFSASEALECLRSGKERTYTTEEVRRELGWKVEYLDAARRQLHKLNRQISQQILDYMDLRIAAAATRVCSANP